MRFFKALFIASSLFLFVSSLVCFDFYGQYVDGLLPVIVRMNVQSHFVGCVSSLEEKNPIGLNRCKTESIIYGQKLATYLGD